MIDCLYLIVKLNIIRIPTHQPMSFSITGIKWARLLCFTSQFGELEMKKQFLGFVLFLFTTVLIAIDIFRSDKVCI